MKRGVTRDRFCFLMAQYLRPLLAAFIAFVVFSFFTGHAQNIESPVYSGLWLPAEYLPNPFSADKYTTPPTNDPPRTNGSQMAAIYVPDPNGGDDDKWIWVYIDGMSLHKSTESAKRWMEFQQTDSTMGYRKAKMGDEALVPLERIRLYLGNRANRYFDTPEGFLMHENLRDRSHTRAPEVTRRNLLVDPIRMGRVTVGLRVEGSWIEQVQGSHWTMVRDTPTVDQIIEVGNLFVEAIRKYSQDQGWNDGETKCGCSRQSAAE